MSRATAFIARHATTALLLALTLIYVSEISSIKSQFDEGFVSTRFLPRLLAGVALGAIAVIAWREERASRPDGDDTADGFSLHAKPLGLFLGVLGYIALFQPLGFVLSTIALSLSTLWLFDFAAERSSLLVRILHNLLWAAVLTGLAYLLFSVAFGARLPLFPELG